MKKILREYFQVFQDINYGWEGGKLNTRKVSPFALILGIIISPIAIVFIVISLILKPVLLWLEND